MIVTGCVTSGCIRATTIDSFSYGFRTMSEDCVGDHDPVPHHQNLKTSAAVTRISSMWIRVWSTSKIGENCPLCTVSLATFRR